MLMNITDFNPSKFLVPDDELGYILTLIWILPIFIFVFYGQQIQLYVTSRSIRKGIKLMKTYSNDSRDEILAYSASLKLDDLSNKMNRIMEHFLVMPVDMDPSGIVNKVRYLVRSRDDYMKKQIQMLAPNISEVEQSRFQTLFEIVTTLHLYYKIVNHLYLTAKKQKNFPLILPLQMMLPFILQETKALRQSVPAFRDGQPIGDGIGPLVVGQLMFGTDHKFVAENTVLATKDIQDRHLYLVKARGPHSTVGQLGNAISDIVTKNKIDLIIAVDASLKLEGEEPAQIAQGFGVAMGGIGTERFQIEELSVKHDIPIRSIVVKQSIRDAMILMSEKISNQVDYVQAEIFEMICEDTSNGDSVLIVGVGNTSGVAQ